MNFFKKMIIKRKEYKKQIKESKIFENYKKIDKIKDNINFGKIYYLIELCPNLNPDIGLPIETIIPEYETPIYCLYAIEHKTKQRVIIVFTNYKIWVIKDMEYTFIDYNVLFKFEILSKSIRTQIINLNDIILKVDTSRKNIKSLYNFLYNKEVMIKEIKEKTAYLCGIIPIEQMLNKIYSGVTINDKTIIFHNKKINNYVCNFYDIENYELYEDNICALKRNNDVYSHSLTGLKQRCTTMTIKITMKDKREITINLLESNAFVKQYGLNDTRFIEAYNFGKSVMKRLDKIN